MAITVDGVRYVSGDEAAKIRSVSRSAIWQGAGKGHYGTVYVYDAGVMRPRNSRKDGRREGWLLLSAVTGYTPRKPGPKPETPPEN